MKSLIFVLAFTSVAMAQQTKPVFTINNPMEKYDDTTDLGKAMMICAKHRAKALNAPNFKGGINIEYQDGWEKCNDVHRKWEESQEGKDKDFIAKVAK